MTPNDLSLKRPNDCTTSGGDFLTVTITYIHSIRGGSGAQSASVIHYYTCSLLRSRYILRRPCRPVISAADVGWPAPVWARDNDSQPIFRWQRQSPHIHIVKLYDHAFDDKLK